MARRVAFLTRKTTELLVVHCAATKPTMDVGVREIRQWHVQKGWLDVGYHYVIRRDGTVEEGRPHDAIGSHVAGHNSTSLGICLVGGIDAKGKAEANFTDAQYGALNALLTGMVQGRSHGGAYTDLPVVGHRDLNAGKECPSFDVKSWWNEQIA